jgi:eukaryotic-like serine/threonine-protein kinase
LLETGDVVADRYEVVGHLGHGGMAEVLRAHDRVLERDVGLKVLSSRRAADPTLRRYFRREALLAAKLSHPHVVAVHDTGEQDGQLYIVMELVEGGTLDDRLREDGPLAVDRAVEIAVAAASALTAAHRAGMVHRDVKPSNILFDGDGGVKVADFGLARGVSATTRTSEIYGSVPYMAPEQAQGDPVDARTDIYALGCVVYETLTGRAPFTGDTPIQVISQHLHRDPPPLREQRDDLPAGFDAVIGRALAKDPDDRYPDAVSFSDDLARVRDGRHVGAAPATTRPLEAGDQEGSSRNRRLALLGLVGVAALALLAVLALAGGDPEQPLGDIAVEDDGTDEEAADDAQPRNAPARDAPQEAADEPAPAEQEEPAPPASGVPAVQQSADRVIRLFDEGASTGAVTSDARDDVMQYIEGALDEAQDGDWDDALDDVETAREKVRDHRDDGEITGEWAERLDGALAEMEQRVRASG